MKIAKMHQIWMQKGIWFRSVLNLVANILMTEVGADTGQLLLRYSYHLVQLRDIAWFKLTNELPSDRRTWSLSKKFGKGTAELLKGLLDKGVDHSTLHL